MSSPRYPFNVMADLLKVRETKPKSVPTAETLEAELQKWHHGVARALAIRGQPAETKRPLH